MTVKKLWYEWRIGRVEFWWFPHIDNWRWKWHGRYGFDAGPFGVFIHGK